MLAAPSPSAAPAATRRSWLWTSAGLRLPGPAPPAAHGPCCGRRDAHGTHGSPTKTCATLAQPASKPRGQPPQAGEINQAAAAG